LLAVAICTSLNTHQAALKQAEADSGGPPVNAGFENFRVMFHTATRDHKLPDLIWNQQVRCSST